VPRGDAAGESTIFSLRLIYNTELAGVGSSGVEPNDATIPTPAKIKNRVVAIPPTTTANNEARKTLENFIIYMCYLLPNAKVIKKEQSGFALLSF
jgi:hypothetical protein